MTELATRAEFSLLSDLAWWLERTEERDGCLVWTRAIQSQGYGNVCIAQKWYRAHRLAYEQCVGPIPTGLELDHLCRNRACVNPEHLEAVTHRENLRRGVGFPAQQAQQKTCKHGHPLAGDNLYEWRGHRFCRTCRNATWRRGYREGKAWAR